MTELIVVLAVTTLLTGLLLPALSRVRENLNRVVCSSNMRQLGLAMTMYGRDHKDRLPYSRELVVRGLPQELMVAHLHEPDQWDGLGLLYSGGYLTSQECFYCPSHHGEHPVDRFDWRFPDGQRIYTNYHYAGHVTWQEPRMRRRIDDDDGIILAADGFRTREDMNHDTGMNILRGDGSVRWFDDALSKSFAEQVPMRIEPPDEFSRLWSELENIVP